MGDLSAGEYLFGLVVASVGLSALAFGTGAVKGSFTEAAISSAIIIAIGLPGFFARRARQ